MSHEALVALEITNENLYQDYRNHMTPLLKTFDGGFRYDFKVSEVLKNEGGKKINRVFVIYFGSKEKMDSFFSHPDYLKFKQEFFAPSVGDVTIISEYSRDV